MSVIDWVVRTLLLVLAGMATLAVIGSIAAIPAGGLPQMIDYTLSPGGGGMADGTVGTAPAAPPPAPGDAWMESLTYAMIALAGIAAAMLLVLMRIAGHLADIARRGSF